MKTLRLFTANIPSILCLVVSAVLAIEGIEGWGWFLFAGMMLCRFDVQGTDED